MLALCDPHVTSAGSRGSDVLQAICNEPVVV